MTQKIDERRKGITMAGNPVTLLGHALTVGEKALDFTALKQDLTSYSLHEAGDKVKIISVVPSLDTGVCELQTVRFNKEAETLKNTVVITLSVDLPFAQGRFCGAKNIDHLLTLSDHRDLDFGLKYGFVIEELRLLSRGIVVLDGDNTVKHIEYVAEVTDHPDYDAALNVAKALV